VNTYTTDRTALLIVDPYNDFMSEGGKLYDAIKETADASGMFGNLRKIISRVRSAGIQVFIVPDHRFKPHEFNNWQHVNMFQKAGLPTRAFEVGTWGGEFSPEFGPQDGDVVIKETLDAERFRKHRPRPPTQAARNSENRPGRPDRQQLH
jgi:nicotinamidase-related amidase